jgi:hypothetical protein
MQKERPMVFKAGMLIPLLLVAAASGADVPRFDAAGEIGVPADYREWVFLSSGLNMNYDLGGPSAENAFDNVFVNPAAWRVFKATGRWPEGTVFVKEGRHCATKGSINRTGQFQDGEATYAELHIRDTKRFKSGWGFFELQGSKPARVLPTTASCYACHQQNGAVQTTFVQFYPTAKPIAVKAGTFDATK